MTGCQFVIVASLVPLVVRCAKGNGQRLTSDSGKAHSQPEEHAGRCWDVLEG